MLATLNMFGAHRRLPRRRRDHHLARAQAQGPDRHQRRALMASDPSMSARDGDDRTPVLAGPWRSTVAAAGAVTPALQAQDDPGRPPAHSRAGAARLRSELGNARRSAGSRPAEEPSCCNGMDSPIEEEPTVVVGPFADPGDERAGVGQAFDRSNLERRYAPRPAPSLNPIMLRFWTGHRDGTIARLWPASPALRSEASLRSATTG